MEKPENLFKLYGVVEIGNIKNNVSITEAVEEAVKGGVSIILLKDNDKNEDEIIKTALELKPVCSRHNVPLLISNSIHAAYKSGADGVHMELEDADLIYARRILGENAVIGTAVHNLYEAQAASAAGADYLTYEALLSPPENNSFDELTRICDRISLPVVAFGSINQENAARLRNTGVTGIGAESAVFGQENIGISAMVLRQITEKF